MNLINLPSKLLTIGKKELSKNKFESIKNDPDFIKPKGGIWTSPYTPCNKYISDWHEWCANENYREGLSNDSVIIKPKEDAMYYCIDSQEDLMDLIKIVGEQKSQLNGLINHRMWIIPDWEKTIKICDIIYLTEKGMRETYLPIYNREYNLYGWDCETCLILNYDCIESWEYKKLDIIK